MMARALDEAAAAGAAGDVPIGAVLVDGAGIIIAASGNRVERDHDPTAHAEMVVLREGARELGARELGARQLGARGGGIKLLAGCDLYATLEPCPMCAAAIGLAHVRRLYFAAYDPKGGGVEHGARIFDQPTCHHRPEIYGGIAERASGDLLRRFFQARR